MPPWSLKATGSALALTGICNIVVQGLLVKRAVSWIGEWGAVLAGLVFGALFGFTYARFVAPGHPQVPGSAFFLAAGLHAVAAVIAVAVMARSPDTAGVSV